mgnify:CR=1 FL=1
MHIAVTSPNLDPPMTLGHLLQMNSTIVRNYLIELIIICSYFDTAYMNNLCHQLTRAI